MIQSTSFPPTALGEGVPDALSPSGPTQFNPFDFAPDDDEAIEAYIDRLPKERVVEALYIAGKMRRMFASFEKMASSRIVGEGILSQAEVWTSPDGIEFFWSGDRHREVKEPAPLKTALTALSSEWGILAKRALKAAFKPQDDKVYLTELDRVAKYATNDDEVIQTIRDFTTWVEGSPKLRPVEEEKKWGRTT